MITYVKYKEIDFQKWDNSIEKAANGNIYAFSWYLNAACEQWDALIEDDYKAVMPLPFRSKMGIKYIFPPTFTQQLGIFSADKISPDKTEEFLEHIPSSFKYVEINLNHYNTVKNPKYKPSTHINLCLDLNKTEDELQDAYSKNTDRNINKSVIGNLQIRLEGDIRNLLPLFKADKAAAIKSLPDDFYTVAEKIGAELKQRKLAKVWEIYVDNELRGGVLFAFSHNKVYFLFSALTPIVRQNRLMHVLINIFIQEHAEEPLVLDFEGSDNNNLARFYKGFGATEENYQKIVINRIPSALVSLARKIKNK